MAEGGLDTGGWGAGSESCMELIQVRASNVGFVTEVREVRVVSTMAEGGLNDDGWGAGSESRSVLSKARFVREVRKVRVVSTVAEGGLDADG